MTGSAPGPVRATTGRPALTAHGRSGSIVTWMTDSATHLTGSTARSRLPQHHRVTDRFSDCAAFPPVCIMGPVRSRE